MALAISACGEEPAVERLRPISMTTRTATLGLLPLIFFGGDLWFGMAIVRAFGLGVGTVLTLGVVAVPDTWFYRVSVKSAPEPA